MNLYELYQTYVKEYHITLTYEEFVEQYKGVRKMEMTKEEHLSKALDLIIQWAIECDFGYDNIPEEYEHYKDEIKDMGYAEGLRYIVMKESFYDKSLYQREMESEE